MSDIYNYFAKMTCHFAYLAAGKWPKTGQFFFARRAQIRAIRAKYIRAGREWDANGTPLCPGEAIHLVVMQETASLSVGLQSFVLKWE